MHLFVIKNCMNNPSNDQIQRTFIFSFFVMLVVPTNVIALRKYDKDLKNVDY